MKRTMVLLLLGSMLVMTAGCQKNGEEAKETDNNTGQSDDSSGEVTELVYWKSYNVDVYKDFIEKFNEEHPDIHVTYETFPDHASTLQKIQCRHQREMPRCLM